MRLADKVAIITGAGSGIGRAAAYLFAREGARVLVADVNEAGGAETVANIRKNRGDSLFVRTDVSRNSDVAELIRIILEQYGKIDILCNVAGIFMSQTPVESIEESLWERIYAINVKGTFLTIKHTVPVMKKAGGGVIINTASMQGVTPAPLLAAYASSKGAIVTLTRGLAPELAPFKIRVNCVCPMLTETPMMQHLSSEQKKKTAGITPMGRLGQPEDMANAALFLASDEAALISGIALQVDGGGKL